MTLIVGILCSDGVVIAADSAATYGAAGQPTIAQPTQKIEISESAVIMASAGAVGLSQRAKHAIAELWRGGKFSGKNAVEAGVIIGNALKEHLLVELEAAQLARNVIGKAAIDGAVCVCMVGLPVSKTPALIQFNECGAPEVATGDLQFVSLGSGQLTADPFLAFLRDRFWPNRQPVLSEGIFAAYWTLDYAISHSPGGLAHPIHVAVLEKGKDGWKPRRLTDAELDDHRQQIRAIEGYLSNYPKSGSTTEPPPTP
jgi:hypothetical protein